MATVRDVLRALETVAPRRLALPEDKVGHQIGDLDQPVSRAVVALDRSLGAVRLAADLRAELLLAHHPLIFDPIGSVDSSTHTGRTILQLIRQGTAFIAAHTNWDAAEGGVNDALAGLLGLTDVRPFGKGADVSHLKLAFTCPHDAADPLIDAASKAGAGVIGAYSRCAFSTAGTGTFEGDESTHPAVGHPGIRESIAETRVEMTVRRTDSRAVVRAIRQIHPYEEPAIDLYQLQGTTELPLGRVGKLAEPMPLREFSAHLDGALNVRSWTWGDPSARIRRVAVMGGSADSAWMDAQRVDADVLVTGEVKQHVGLEASESGMALIAAGHYQTEHPGAAALRDRMQVAVPEIEWTLFTPGAGLHGHPF